MSNHPDLSVLPEADQTELLQLVKAKLSAAEQEAMQLKERLSFTNDAIAKYKIFLGFVHKHVTSAESPGLQMMQGVNINLASAPGDSYNPNWTQAAKILYVLRQPAKYGVKTFMGALGVVASLVQEEPGLRADANVVKKFGPTLSRMANDGLVVKMLEKGSKSRIHYLSPEWFEDGKPKPEYEKTVSNLELLTAIESPSVTAEEDANPDTGEAKPPVDMVKEALPDS